MLPLAAMGLGVGAGSGAAVACVDIDAKIASEMADSAAPFGPNFLWLLCMMVPCGFALDMFSPTGFTRDPLPEMNVADAAPATRVLV